MNMRNRNTNERRPKSGGQALPHSSSHVRMKSPVAAACEAWRSGPAPNSHQSTINRTYPNPSEPTFFVSSRRLAVRRPVVRCPVVHPWNPWNPWNPWLSPFGCSIRPALLCPIGASALKDLPVIHPALPPNWRHAAGPRQPKLEQS